MQSNRSIEPPDSAAPGVIPAPVDVHVDTVAAHDGRATEATPGETSGRADSPGAGNRVGGPFARLLSVVRGDRYMADAYEPAWSALVARRVGAGVARRDDNGELAVEVRAAVESEPTGARDASSPARER
jgi:hypothetical protein